MTATIIIWGAIVVAIGAFIGLLTEVPVGRDQAHTEQYDQKAALKAYRWKVIMQTTDLRAGTRAGEAKIDVKTQM